MKGEGEVKQRERRGREEGERREGRGEDEDGQVIIILC